MAKNEAAIPNPALQPLSVLVGEWNTVAKHRLIASALHGHTTFEWLEGGAFLMQHSETEEEGVPSAVGIFGSDNATGELFILYFDERGVSRKFEMTLRDNVWKYWRNAAGPGVAQRFTGTIADEGNTIIAVWEISEDGSTWIRDLESTYTRVK